MKIYLVVCYPEDEFEGNEVVVVAFADESVAKNYCDGANARQKEIENTPYPKKWWERNEYGIWAGEYGITEIDLVNTIEEAKEAVNLVKEIINE